MNEKLTYKGSGVDVEAGYQAVNLIKGHAMRTVIPGVLGNLGSFGGFFELDREGYKNPVLVSGTDGVGTKLRIAFMTGKHDTIGIDCVAMCVNDVVCHGAKPLFFLDYIGTGKVEPNVVADIVKGICDGCVEAGCALIGGETAEMPGFYKPGEYDVVGFTVGMAEKSEIINGSEITEGDVLIGLASSGVHSNGYSLIRKVFFEINKFSLNTRFDDLGHSLEEELLKPTRIYAKAVQGLLKKNRIKGIAHITGGGFIENIPRMLPTGLKAAINLGSWEVQPVFRLIQKLGNIDEKEMYNTFNMGIGLVLAAGREEADEILRTLGDMGEKAYIIGSVVKGEGGIELCRR